MLTLIEGGITYLEETAIYRDDAKRARHIGLFESARRAVHRRLHEHGIPALKASFYPNERSREVFTWDPI